MRARLAAAVVSISLLALAPASARAQGAAAGPPARVVFRAIGDDGQPVGDLAAADLSLKVNGKQRLVQSLSRFVVTDTRSDSALPPPYASNSTGARGRVVYVLLDDDSISPGREAQIKDVVRMLTAELSPADRLGVLNTQGTINLTPSTDQLKVRRAIDSFTGKAGASETDDDTKCRTRRVLAAVGTMLTLGGSAPETILVFSSGLSTPETKRVAVGSRTSAGTSDVCPVDPETFSSIGSLASLSNADFYLFHVLDGLATPLAPTAAGFESLGGVTGAELFRLPGNVQPVLSRLLRESAAYYVATFEPEPGERNGQSLRLDLRSTRDTVKLRAHPALQIRKAVAVKAASPREMLRVAAEYHDLPLRATAVASKLPAGPDVRVVALFEPIDAATPLAAASVGLFDANGTLKAQWTAQKEDLAKRPARADLQAPPGTYRIRVAAVDAAGRSGTTDDDVRVETVRADPLTLSALVIGTQQGGGFAPRLEFTSELVALGLVEIYGVPKDGTVTAALDVASTPDGAPLATADAQIARGASDDARRAVGGFSIAALPPGDYLMRATVFLDGKAVGRVMRTLRKAR